MQENSTGMIHTPRRSLYLGSRWTGL